MGIERARTARDHGRQRKCEHLVTCDRDSHRPRRDPVVTDRHDRTPLPGINQVENHDRRNEEDNESDRKVGIKGRTGNTLRPGNDHLPVLGQAQRSLVLD